MPPLDHQVERPVAHERAVLDTVDARLDRRPDAVAVGVGRHPEPGAVGLVGHGPQLLVEVLLGARRAGVRHDPARSTDLDRLRPRCLIWYRTALRTSATPSAMPSSTVRGRTFGASSLGAASSDQVPASGRDGVPRGHHPQAVDPPEKVDGLAGATSSRIPAVCTNRPRFRTVVNPDHRVRRALATARRVFTAGSSCTGRKQAAVVGPAHQQVDLHVHQARQQGQVAQVGRPGPSGTDIGATSTIRSPSTSRSPGSISSTLVHVEHAGAPQVDGRLGGAGTGHARGFPPRTRRSRSSKADYRERHGAASKDGPLL